MLRALNASKKVQTYIDGLQICPDDMQEEYAFQIDDDKLTFEFVERKDTDDNV